MEYRHLGSCGLQVSALSFGAWVTFGQQFGEELAHECMKVAYDGGVNFFDGAEVYQRGRAEEGHGKSDCPMGLDAVFPGALDQDFLGRPWTQ